MAPRNSAAMWDERYQGDAQPYGVEPSRYLREKVALIRPGGDVLLPGDGGGRNGVWLAGRGFRTHLLDFSRQGLEAARRWADESGVVVGLEQADVLGWGWPAERFDAVVSVYLHLPEEQRAQVHRAMVRALKPGGILLIEGFHKDQMAHTSGGPRDPAMLFSEEALRSDLTDADLLEIRRDEVVLDESPLHRGPAVVLRVTARS